MTKHNVVIARYGSFVGLYRLDGDVMKLWRPIINDQYSRQNIIFKTKKPCSWGSGGNLGISGKWFCNEMHDIPKGYDVHNMKHMRYLATLLGGSHERVAKRIKDMIPSDKENIE